MDSKEYRTSNPETWNKVAEIYTDQLSVLDYELADELMRVFYLSGIGKGAKILELGSGSGHLSAIMAQSGYSVSLLDFSSAALDKSRELFESQGLTGEFINGDIFELDNLDLQKYDLVWNSGVMEHFNDEELLRLCSSIHNVCKNQFIFTVPNPKSLPYLMFRYISMAMDRWIYGKEFLRYDYDKVILSAGFNKVEKAYMGRGCMADMFSLFSNSNVANFLIDDMNKNDLIPPEQSYLITYIASKDKDFELNLVNYEKLGNTEQWTDYFDMMARKFTIK